MQFLFFEFWSETSKETVFFNSAPHDTFVLCWQQNWFLDWKPEKMLKTKFWSSFFIWYRSLNQELYYASAFTQDNQIVSAF